MEGKWVEFEEGPCQTGDGRYVSMSPIGEILINRHTYAEMNKPEAVVMLFNEEAGSIGLRPASPLMPNAFPLKNKGRCGHHLIRAKPFITKYDIRIDATVRFRSAVVEDGMLILDLRQMVFSRRTPRAGSKRRR